MTLRQFFIFLIKFYKKYLSKLFLTSCRFYPTCSEYALIALSKHNFFYSLFLILSRLIRCTLIFFPAGYDPVP
ncbi:MAG: membrane protein insertion efficiency factor YidD [Clostridiales bacterium]|nr:membrane protein insertion efficiency factor YidD [Clostridiales bacterium]